MLNLDKTQPGLSLASGVLLAPHTTFKLGGPAEHLVTVGSIPVLCNVVQCCVESTTPVRILGGGSNLLVPDQGVKGWVIRLDPSFFGGVYVSGTRVLAGAAARLDRVARLTVREGLKGLESLSGIPGTIGGAVSGNSGTAVSGVCDLLREVVVLDRQGQLSVRPRERLSFGYRKCDLEGFVILWAVLELQRSDPRELASDREQCLRKKRLAQPLGASSAGCVFKNPTGISAGWLIEEAGLVGCRVGGAHVSRKHANFIVADRGCSSNDVLALIDAIRERVYRFAEVELELELVIWG